MRKSSQEFVTTEVFEKRLGKVDEHFAALERDIATVAQNVLAIKSQVNHLVNTMDDFAKKTHRVEQNQEVHRGYIHDHEERLIALEKPYL